MFIFKRNILFSLLVVTVNFGWCRSQQFADECGLSIFDILNGATSASQPDMATKSNGSDYDYYDVPDYKAERIWMLIRHGTRRPKVEKIFELRELEDFRNEIVLNLENQRYIPFCESDWQKLKEWRWDETITDHQAQMFNSQGQEEIKSIANNYLNSFPELFDMPYDPVKFNFQHSESDRTRDSFNAFVDEIFGDNVHTQISAEPTAATQALLKPYKSCVPFILQQKVLKENSDSEVKKFQNSKTFKRVMKRISKRLGFHENLKKRQIMSIFDMCRYDQPWNVSTTNIWCRMFTPYEVKVLEYAKDLSGYYEFGYGSDMNRRIQCSTVRDMVKHLAADSDPRVTVYFGHSSALLLHLTAIGAFEDEKKLTAKNFDKMPYRKWSTSKMIPFAGNLAAVRYENNQVKFFLNEELINFDWCADGACDIEVVKHRYRHFKNCKQIFCPKKDKDEEEASVSPVDVFEDFFGVILRSIF